MSEEGMDITEEGMDIKKTLPIEAGKDKPEIKSRSPILTALEKVNQIASAKGENLRNTQILRQAAITAEGQLRNLGITTRPQLQEFYALGYLDLQIAKFQGNYDPLKPLVSEAGRNFRVLDSTVDRMDYNPLDWEPKINSAIADQVKVAYIGTRDQVLKQKKINVETEAEIPEDAKEEIKRLAEEKIRQIREEAAEDPTSYLEKIAKRRANE